MNAAPDRSSVSPTPGPPGRAQFALGPRVIDRAGWRHIDLGDCGKLSVHEDLEITSAEAGGRELILLGYMLDWQNPQHSNAQIAQRLVADSPTIESCIANTDELCGRWIVIFRCAGEHSLFHDPGGLRQVCFTDVSTGKPLQCASQPRLLAEIAGLQELPSARKFIDAMEAVNPEYWWPGDRLPYGDSRVLLPNHALNIKSGLAYRFFPNEQRGHLNTGEVVARACARLTATLDAAAKRYKLVLGLSAGLDSRLLLAASRGISESLQVYNVCPDGVPDSHPDVEIPRSLCAGLDVAITPLTQSATASDGFLKNYRQHSWHPRRRFASGVESQFNAFNGSRVAVIGNFAEVAKLPYRNRLTKDSGRLSSELAAAVKMQGQQFAEQAIGDWIASIKNDHGYHIADLFYWEQRVGRWLATNQVEFDFGWQDILVPLNNRAMIKDLLAVTENDRKPAKHRLFLLMISRMWPETLSLPINPKQKKSKWQIWRKRLRKLIRRR